MLTLQTTPSRRHVQGQHAIQKHHCLSPEGSSRSPPLPSPPPPPPPRRLHPAQRPGWLAVTGSQTQRTGMHTPHGAWVMVPELRDQSTRSLWAPTLSLAAAPCVPEGAASPAGNPGSRGCSRSICLEFRRGMKKGPLRRA